MYIERVSRCRISPIKWTVTLDSTPRLKVGTVEQSGDGYLFRGIVDAQECWAWGRSIAEAVRKSGALRAAGHLGLYDALLQ